MFCILTQRVDAQSVSTLVGARNAGLGYVSSVLSDEWSLFNNVGGMSNYKNFSLAIAYEIDPSLPGSNRAAGAISIPIKKGTFGFGFFRFGDPIYNEQVLSTGYSHRLGIASLGIRITYIQSNTEAKGFNNKSSFGVTIGGLAEITPKIFVGAYAFNINQALTASSDKERIPTILALGFAFIPYERLTIAAEVEKDLEYDLIVKGGIEYRVLKKIFFRVGFNLNPNNLFAGVGYQLRKLGIDYALQYNLEQEFRHQISIRYQVKN